MYSNKFHIVFAVGFCLLKFQILLCFFPVIDFRIDSLNLCCELLLFKFLFDLLLVQYLFAVEMGITYFFISLL